MARRSPRRARASIATVSAVAVAAALLVLLVLLATSGAAFAQARAPGDASCVARFVGAVLDADGDAVAGATVRGPGGARWTTDHAGRFLGSDALPCDADRVVLTATLEHPAIKGGSAGDAQPVPVHAATSTYTVNFVLDVDQDAIPGAAAALASTLYGWFVQGALGLGAAYLVTGGFRLRPHPRDDPDLRTSFEIVSRAEAPAGAWAPPTSVTSFTVVDVADPADARPRE